MAIDSGRPADPARSLALLWRTQDRVARKGKTDLSVDRIVQAAIVVADSDWPEPISMRRVAERLGVGTMSLYTHVYGKAELMEAMLDAVYGELPAPDPAAGGWRGQLEFLARENWALCHRHPWLLQVQPGRPGLGPNSLAKYERELRAIAGLGLTEVEMDSVVSLVAGHAEGAARRSIEARQTERLTGMSDEQWWQVQAPLLSKLVDAQRFPVASRVGAAVGAEQGTAYEPDRAFEFGLARILDGIAALVTARASDG